MFAYPLVFPLMIFLSVTAALMALYWWLAPTRTDERLQALASPSDSSWSQSIVKMVGPLARLSTPTGQWEDSPLRVRLFNAGIRNEDASLIYFSAKTVMPILFAVLAYSFLLMLSLPTLSMLFYVLIAATLGCYAPNVYLYWRIKSRQREIFENFPDAADLMLVCIEAGLGLDAALTRVTEEMQIKSVVLAEELHLTNLEIRAGGTREKSLRNLATRTGVEEVGTFAIMLTQADKFGTSIGVSLRIFSDDLRHKRQIRAEEKAAKVPTKMLFPLVVCIFPSIIMVIMGPAAIQVIRTLMPMLGGGAR